MGKIYLAFVWRYLDGHTIEVITSFIIYVQVEANLGKVLRQHYVTTLDLYSVKESVLWDCHVFNICWDLSSNKGWDVESCV